MTKPIITAGRKELSGCYLIYPAPTTTENELLDALREHTDLPIAAHATVLVSLVDDQRVKPLPANKTVFIVSDRSINFKTGAVELTPVELPRHPRSEK